MRRVLTAIVATLALLTPACSNVVAGTAAPDPRQPGVALTDDGAGIVVGFADAPVQIEIFAEPQCPHCATLQFNHGEQISEFVASGRLAVTYRLLTFLDLGNPTGYSSTVVNALYHAADPGTSATQFQAFVEELWANQDLAGTRYRGADFARMATQIGLPDAVANSIESGATAVNPGRISDANADLLLMIEGDVHTPVVYDLISEQTIDISDEDWLVNLMRRG